MRRLQSANEKRRYWKIVVSECNKCTYQGSSTIYKLPHNIRLCKLRSWTHDEQMSTVMLSPSLLYTHCSYIVHSPSLLCSSCSYATVAFHVVQSLHLRRIVFPVKRRSHWGGQFSVVQPSICFRLGLCVCVNNSYGGNMGERAKSTRCIMPPIKHCSFIHNFFTCYLCLSACHWEDPYIALFVFRLTWHTIEQFPIRFLFVQLACNARLCGTRTLEFAFRCCVGATTFNFLWISMSWVGDIYIYRERDIHILICYPSSISLYCFQESFFVILVFMYLSTCMGLACLYLLLLFLCVVMDSTLLPDWVNEPACDSVRISCRSVMLRI